MSIIIILLYIAPIHPPVYLSPAEMHSHSSRCNGATANKSGYANERPARWSPGIPWHIYKILNNIGSHHGADCFNFDSRTVNVAKTFQLQCAWCGRHTRTSRGISGCDGDDMVKLHSWTGECIGPGITGGPNRCQSYWGRYRYRYLSEYVQCRVPAYTEYNYLVLYI